MAAPTKGYQLDPAVLGGFRVPQVLRPFLSNGAFYFDSFSIDLWFYLNSFSQYGTLLSCKIDGNGDIGSFNDPGLLLYLRNISTEGFASFIGNQVLRKGDPQIGVWTHFCYTFDRENGRTAKIFENGVELGSVAVSEADSKYRATPEWIDYYDYSSGEKPIDGEIARLRFWRKALVRSFAPLSTGAQQLRGIDRHRAARNLDFRYRG